MNFRRNKECRECGALCNDQSRSDEHWGPKKASSWGSSSPRNAPPSDMGDKGRSGNKYPQSRLGPSRKLLEDADDDLEEDADVIFRRDNGDDGKGLAKSFKMSQRGTKFKSDVSKDDESLSDLDFSDLDDTPTNKKKGKQNHASKNKKNKEDEDDDEDAVLRHLISRYFHEMFIQKLSLDSDDDGVLICASITRLSLTLAS